jgi:hypothetical protein
LEQPEENASQPREPVDEKSEFLSDFGPFETPRGPLVLKSRTSGEGFLEETLNWGECEVVIRVTTGTR